MVPLPRKIGNFGSMTDPLGKNGGFVKKKLDMTEKMWAKSFDGRESLSHGREMVHWRVTAEKNCEFGCHGRVIRHKMENG